jgi:hypothetical protein
MLMVTTNMNIGYFSSPSPIDICAAGNDLKADAYRPANRSLLWRRWMTNVLLSP